MAILQWNPYPKIFSFIKLLIVNRLSKFFVALLRLFGMQNGDMLMFFLRSFRKVRFRKMQLLKDGVQTVVTLACNTMLDQK